MQLQLFEKLWTCLFLVKVWITKNDLIRTHDKLKFMDSNADEKSKSGSSLMHFIDSYCTWNILRKEINEAIYDNNQCASR